MEDRFPHNNNIKDDTEKVIKYTVLGTIIFYSVTFLIAVFIAFIALVVIVIVVAAKAALDLFV